MLASGCHLLTWLKCFSQNVNSLRRERRLRGTFIISWISFKNGPITASFSFIFGLFQANNTIFTANQKIKNVQMSIQYTAPGFEHESSPIANRPGLLPLSWIWFVQEFRIKGSWFFPLNFIDKFRIQFRAVFFSNLIKMSGDELPTHKIFCNFFALSMQNKFCTFSPTMCLSIFEANTLSSHLSLGCCRNSRYALIVVNKSVEQQNN